MDRNILLLFGGDSDERLVSVASAQAMASAISPKLLWFWHHDGPIYAITYQELMDHKDPFTAEFIPKNKPVFKNVEEAIRSNESNGHVFLLGLHGGSGENGYVQALLEQWQRPFTGSSAAASRCAFDKIATKECLRPHAIKMAPQVVIEPHDKDHIKQVLMVFFAEHQEIIAKPVCGGSSLGCFFITKEGQIEEAAAEIKKLARPFMAEKIIHGREITVGVIEDFTGVRALLGTEIVVEKDHSFDYLGKYLGKGTKEITPALLTDPLMREAQRISVAAHLGLSLSGYSRSDLILAADGFYYLETNTLPGLTKSSLVPQQLAVAGISLREFLSSQIELAVRRMPG
jgi:D-alanine-D-alanine ligase